VSKANTHKSVLYVTRAGFIWTNKLANLSLPWILKQYYKRYKLGL